MRISTKSLKVLFVACYCLFGSLIHSKEKRFDISVVNADLRVVLDSVAQKAALGIQAETNVDGRITLHLVNSTLANAIDEIATKANLEVHVTDGTLHAKRKPKVAGQRSNREANVSEQNSSGENQAQVNGPLAPRTPATLPLQVDSKIPSTGNVKVLKLRFAKAEDLAAQLKSVFTDQARIIPDAATNSLMIIPLSTSYANIEALVNEYDKMPDQILIEAQIVETSSSFAQQMGVSWGNLGYSGGSVGAANSAVAIKNSAPSPANLALGVAFGSIGGSKLEATLQAAESNGDAKIISKPKVVTADRNAAVIESGISYHVKTLSSVSSGGSSSGSNGGSQGSNVSGGLQTVSAGLNLNVTPEIVDGNLIRLQIDISSSEADTGNSVDGIPGVVRSAAKTSLIVKEGVTATIGGLVKYSSSKNEGGVPFLKDLPFLGWMFKSSTHSKNNNELLIFITPRILERPIRDTASEE